MLFFAAISYVMPSNLHNRTDMKDVRKLLRNDGTKAEAALWNLLKNKQLLGRKFRRQHSIGRHVLDFYCPAEKLCIELDGQGHYTPGGSQADWLKEHFVGEHGILVIRIENKAVFKWPEEVLGYVATHFGWRELKDA